MGEKSNYFQLQAELANVKLKLRESESKVLDSAYGRVSDQAEIKRLTRCKEKLKKRSERQQDALVANQRMLEQNQQEKLVLASEKGALMSVLRGVIKLDLDQIEALTDATKALKIEARGS